MQMYEYLASLEDNSTAFTIGIDSRGQAGFAPAILVTFGIPSHSPDALFVGPIVFEASGKSGVLALRRAEYWVLGKAVPVTGMPLLSARHPNADTIYRLFFAVPENAPSEFIVTAPKPFIEGKSVAIPTLRFRRAEVTGGLTLCTSVS